MCYVCACNMHRISRRKGNKLPQSKQRKQLQICRSLSGPIRQLVFFLGDSSYHLRCLYMLSDVKNVGERVWSKWIEISNSNSKMILTAHSAILALQHFFKGRRYPAVCNESGSPIFIAIQSCYSWYLGNSVALQLKKLKSFHLRQAIRYLSCESIIAETQISEV